jgi:hypothetical protein
MAMQKGVLWEGKYYTLPQAASKIDSSALAKSPLGGANVLVILGEMIGLILPKIPMQVGNASLALSLLNPFSEEARLASQLAFDPSPGSGTPGASQVYLLPVNPAVRASGNLVNASAANVLLLTSYMHGLPASQIKRKVESGTVIGKKITIAFQSGIESFDNITKSSFSIQYTGAGSAAAMTIDVTAAGHILATVATGATADNLALDLNVYTTIQALVDAINATGKYTATVLTGSPADSSMDLDTVTAQDIKTAALTAKSDLQALVDKINASSAYCQAGRVADAGTVPANSDWAYLAGGSNGATTNDDWQAAFDALKAMQVDLVLVLSSDASIQSMGDAHCAYMSGPSGKSERRQFVGGALQSWGNPSARMASIAALKTAAANLNSDRTVHAALGCYQYDPNGKQKLYPAYITAAMYAGIAAGGSPVLPLTRKYLRCLGLETNLQIDEVSDLIDSGLAAPLPDPVQGAGYVISRQVTTWNQDQDLYRIEFSLGRGADYTASQVRKRHELIIGQPGEEMMDTTIVNVTNGVLQDEKDAGYIRSYDPAATQLRVDNMIRYVDYSAEQIEPISWIFSTFHLLPTTQTVQL